MKRRPRDSGERLDESFVKRFPDLQPLVDGLKLRMATLAPIHVRALLRLADMYGQQAFLAAAQRAQEYRRFDARAVERILEQTHPLPDGDTIRPLHGEGPATLGEVEPATLDGYGQLDRMDRNIESDGGAHESKEVDDGT